MNLPLLFGILIYLLILISLTVWLTKYHQFHNRSLDLPHHIEPNEADSSLETTLLNSETKEPPIATSGNPVNDNQGGAKTDS